MIIRHPAVAGTLYDADTQRLLSQLEGWLQDAKGLTTHKAPKALLVPHSGYHYSGTVAARAYRLLDPVYDRIRRVVLLGPSHHQALDGLILPDADIFRTPLGDVPVDRQCLDQLRRHPMVFDNAEAHRQEHSLELQLPFLQVALDQFSVVPMIVGQCPADILADILAELWRPEDTLFVISSGLSRKIPLELATEQDTRTSERIRVCDSNLSYQQACGYQALNGFLLLAKRLGLDSKRLALTTSADINGQKTSVRGFGAFAFY